MNFLFLKKFLCFNVSVLIIEIHLYVFVFIVWIAY